MGELGFRAGDPVTVRSSDIDHHHRTIVFDHLIIIGQNIVEGETILKSGAPTPGYGHT